MTEWWRSPNDLPQQVAGIRIVVCPDRPRYVLPEEVIPGVPWPPGFRDEINAWALEFLGTTNVLPPGEAFIINGGIAVMRPEDAVKLTKLRP